MTAMLTNAAQGVYLIAATPFHETGRSIWPSLDRLIDWYLGHGVDGLTILGQLGEAPKLTQEEALLVARRVLAPGARAGRGRRVQPGLRQPAPAHRRGHGCRRRRGDGRAAGDLEGRRCDPGLLPRRDGADGSRALGAAGLPAGRRAADELPPWSAALPTPARAWSCSSTRTGRASTRSPPSAGRKRKARGACRSCAGMAASCCRMSWSAAPMVP